MVARWAGDSEFETFKLENVKSCKSGWTIVFDGGWHLQIAESPVVPKIGMTVTVFRHAFGSPIRGLLLDGQCIYYRTREEEDAKNKADCEAIDAVRREEFERGRVLMDAQYDGLPQCFRDRIDRFRKNNPNFRWKYESYELFVCVEAVAIAQTIGTAEGVAAFMKKDWTAQRSQVPKLSDGHSGNTFGAACRLAMDFLTDENLVRQRHGAMSALVGSKEYGDIP